MAIQTGALATVYVSAALPATNDSAGFALLTFTEILEVTNKSGGTRTDSVTSFPVLKQRHPKKLKGATNYDVVTVEMGYDATDAGQIICASLAAGTTAGSLKILFSDGKIEYVQGLFTSFTLPDAASVDDVVMRTLTVDPTEEPVIV